MTHTIVIPLHPRGGKFRNNTELRYALRSLERHFKDDFEVVIVSSKLPDWIQGVKHIEGGGLKASLRSAAESHPAGFFWFYDDCVLLRDTDGQEMMQTPACKGWGGANTGWSRKLDTIRQRLIDEGLPCFDYSRPHGPYWFDKAMVDEGFADWVGMSGKFPWESWALSKRDWPRRHGIVKQYYGPFRSAPGGGSFFLNYNDAGNSPELRAYLDQTFPTPCRFENPAADESLPVARPQAEGGGNPRPDLAKIRMVVLSAEHYAIRRAAFIESLKQSGGFLNDIPLEVWTATPSSQCYPPPTFGKIRSYKHWWAASCDHLKIMEQSFARDDEFLLFFEDDARFEPDFEERFWQAWDDLPENWNALRLGWRDHKNYVPVTENL
ncbi:MAG: hypothetical protein WCP45_13545, partial [Verrucomicrobiota bacterium]